MDQAAVDVVRVGARQWVPPQSLIRRRCEISLRCEVILCFAEQGPAVPRRPGGQKPGDRVIALEGMQPAWACLVTDISLRIVAEAAQPLSLRR